MCPVPVTLIHAHLSGGKNYIDRHMSLGCCLACPSFRLHRRSWWPAYHQPQLGTRHKANSFFLFTYGTRTALSQQNNYELFITTWYGTLLGEFLEHVKLRGACIRKMLSSGLWITTSQCRPPYARSWALEPRTVTFGVWKTM